MNQELRIKQYSLSFGVVAEGRSANNPAKATKERNMGR